MKILLIVGTRPQIIKSAPVVSEALKQGVDIQIIHTGQHYDHALSQIFFDELSAPEPVANLNVGSGSHVFQTSQIMLKLEKYLVNNKPSLVMVPGDTNSALAGALASSKLGIPVAHLESGARCFDMTMAEEINRRLIDHCSEILFAPTVNCERNLKNESVLGNIHMFGDTMLDVFLSSEPKILNCNIVNKLNIKGEYAIMTTHRAENVDDPVKLKKMLGAIQQANLDVIFPIHPRTQNRLKENGIILENTNIHPIDPIGYIEMLSMLRHAKIVFTDSGGLQKEAFWSKVPSIIMRERVEWIEPVDLGVNFITGAVSSRIVEAIHFITKNYKDIKGRFTVNPFGNGTASKKIIRTLVANTS